MVLHMLQNMVTSVMAEHMKACLIGKPGKKIHLGHSSGQTIRLMEHF